VLVAAELDDVALGAPDAEEEALAEVLLVAMTIAVKSAAAIIPSGTKVVTGGPCQFDE